MTRLHRVKGFWALDTSLALLQNAWKGTGH